MLKTYIDVKSGYSFLQSSLKIEDIIASASKHQITSLALLDKDNMFASIEFYKLCKKNKIHPLIGIDVSVVEEDGKTYSFLLIAKNNNGYKTLCNLTSIVSKASNRFGINFDQLKPYLVDVIVIVPFDRSYLKNLDLLNRIDDLEKVTKRYQETFNDLYIGIGYDLLAKNEVVRNLAKKMNLKKIALPFINIHDFKDNETLKVLQAIKDQTVVNNSVELRSGYFTEIIDINYYAFDELEGLDNIVSLCNVELKSNGFHFIDYQVVSGVKSDELLRSLCLKGLKEKLQDKLNDIYLKRLNYELEVIIKMGYQDYFLVVYDYVKFAKDAKMLVGPGRGSAAGSLVSYALDITEADPIKYNLMFERFLNVERVSMPDIDIDFPDNRRNEVINYIKHRYNHDHFAHVITFSTFGARQALRDAAKALGLPLYQVDSLAKKLPSFDMNSSLKDFYEKYDQVKTTIDNDPLYTKIYQIALKIEGLPRQSSLHAAGIVVAKERLDDLIPVYYYDDTTMATQYDMNFIEEVGLLKMDILGLKNLTIILDCVNDIEKYLNKKIDIHNLNLADDKVYEMIRQGTTLGLFQIESSGMTNALKVIVPTTFEDIVATISLYRPGPMQFINEYASRKNAKASFTYPHPLLEPILKVTYGIIVYQEQIIEILKTMAKFSLGKADIVRRAIGKKNEQLLSSMKSEFISGCLSNNIDYKTAIDIFNLIERFADYGFNRSHSVAYSLITYQMAYLKCYYPSIFFANLLNSFKGASLANNTKLFSYINEAKLFKIKLLPPSINHSDIYFTPTKDGNIYFALESIKGINLNFAISLVEERRKREFDDIYDFVARMGSYELNQKQLEALINAGAFDEFKINRKTLLNNQKELLYYASMAKGNQKGLSSILDVIEKPLLQFVKEDKIESLEREFEVLGMFINGFPLLEQREELKKKGFITIEDIPNKDRQRVFLVLYMQNLRVFKTKKNENMCALECLDETGTIEVVIFPRLYQEISLLLQKGKYIKVDANTSIRNEELSLNATRIIEHYLKEE